MALKKPREAEPKKYFMFYRSIHIRQQGMEHNGQLLYEGGALLHFVEHIDTV